MGTWFHRANRPTGGNQQLAVGAALNKIYALGGNSDINQEYSPTTNTWASRRVIPVPRSDACVANVQDKLYLIGGLGSPGTNFAVYEYSPSSNTWTAKAEGPVNLSYATAGAISSRIYVANWLGLNEYTPSSNSWSSKKAMTTPRNHSAGGVISSRFYVVGGRDTGAATTTDKNEEYTPGSNSWASKRAMPTGRENLGAAVIQSKLYAVMGNSSDHTHNEAYTPSTNLWETKTSSPTRKTGQASTVLDKLYFISSSGAASNLEYDPFYHDPPVATPISPTADQETDLRPTFEWVYYSSMGNSQTRYQVEVYDQVTSYLILTSAALSGNANSWLATADLPEGELEWRVRVYDGVAWGPWSDFASFVVIDPTPRPDPPTSDDNPKLQRRRRAILLLL